MRSIRSSINYFGLRRQRYIVDRLKESLVSLLTVWGEEDIIIPISQPDMIRWELSNSTVHTMLGCWHWPHMEKPDEFNLILTDFLRPAPADGTGSTCG